MYYTYVLKCSDGKRYVGYASDLEKRLLRHRKGQVPATEARLPVSLVYYEACRSRKKALEREAYFKTGFGRRFLKNRVNN